MIFKIAFRSMFRNGRRSLMTLSTIAVGATANLVFGAYMVYVFLGYESITVRVNGHLTVFHNGYFNFGSGNPSAYGIENYQELVKLILDDAVLKPRIAVATLTQSVAGIAGNFDRDASKTFFGVGYIPSDRDRMAHWDEYGLGVDAKRLSALRDSDPAHGVVGVGLARVLGLCEALQVKNCPELPQADSKAPSSGPRAVEDFSELSRRDRASAVAEGGGDPRIDLLAATAGGAPNVVSLYVTKAEVQGVKEFDDNYVGMHLALAQQLLYGRGTRKVTGVVLQLQRTEDMAAVRQRLLALFSEHHLDLEVRDFSELTPAYKQVIGLFGSIFSFISVIIGVVVLFTVTNTMGMSVMERTSEIGTTRALGLRRQGIRRQFLLEGWMLGAIGATAGVLLAALITYAVNHAGLTWLPPGNVEPVPLRLYMLGGWKLVTVMWLSLVVVATIAALIPANRAAKLPVVDALRHE